MNNNVKQQYVPRVNEINREVGEEYGTSARSHGCKAEGRVPPGVTQSQQWHQV